MQVSLDQSDRRQISKQKKKQKKKRAGILIIKEDDVFVSLRLEVIMLPG
jgi:hypothetical protein